MSPKNVTGLIHSAYGIKLQLRQYGYESKGDVHLKYSNKHSHMPSDATSNVRSNVTTCHLISPPRVTILSFRVTYPTRFCRVIVVRISSGYHA